MMTPCILDFVKVIESTDTDPTSLIWFDISSVIKLEVEESKGSLKEGYKRIGDLVHAAETLDVPSPFPVCAFAGSHVIEGHTLSTLLVVAGEDPRKGAMTVSGVRKLIGPRGHSFVPVPAFYYWIDEKNGVLNTALVETSEIEESLIKSQVTGFLILLKDIYKHLAAKTEGYRAVVRPGFINQQRKKKKKPLLYDWTTVVVNPIKPIPQPPKGGTHASPRQHDVRGHQVRSKLGKVFWRKPHKRGDPSKGYIFHDYLVKGVDDGRQTQ